MTMQRLRQNLYTKAHFLGLTARYMNLKTTSDLGPEVRKTYRADGSYEMNEDQVNIDIEYPVNLNGLKAVLVNLAPHYRSSLSTYFTGDPNTQGTAYDAHINEFAEDPTISSPIIMALLSYALRMNIILHINETDKPILLVPYPTDKGPKPQLGDYYRCPMRIVYCGSEELGRNVFQLLMPALYREEKHAPTVPDFSDDPGPKTKACIRWNTGPVVIDENDKSVQLKSGLHLANNCGPKERTWRESTAKTVIASQFPELKSSAVTTYRKSDIYRALERSMVSHITLPLTLFYPRVDVLYCLNIFSLCCSHLS